MIPLQIKLTAGIICGFGERFEPLLVDEGVSGITFPEDESIKNLTQDEYAVSEFNAMQAWRKEAKEIVKEALLYELS